MVNRLKTVPAIIKETKIKIERMRRKKEKKEERQRRKEARIAK